MASPSWQRVLWASQSFPDNHTPDNFLDRLVSQPTGAQPDVKTLIRWSVPLTQQACLTLTFVGIFLHLRDQRITPEWLAIGSATTSALCGATTLRHTRKGGVGTMHDAERRRILAQPLSYALLALVVLALSPLLKTLTEATTSDSITALATALFLLSFALADFSDGTPNTDIGRVSRLADRTRRHSNASSTKETYIDSVSMQDTQLPATLSLNAALCASMVLASRLRSPIEVFSLVLAAICIFAFLPRYLRHRSKRGLPMVLVTLFMVLLSASLLAYFSLAASLASIVMSAFLNLGCPLWMRRAQAWKLSRRGPWDMGVLRLRSHE